ncbi:MAG: hypothetical protein WCQ86_05015 [Bacteroidaceae bacterium]
MHAKKRTLYRRIIAGVLLAALLPMLLVKTFHYHPVSNADVAAAIHGLHQTPAAQLLDSDCPICMFVLQAVEAACISFLFFVPFFLLRAILFRQRILPAFHPLTFLRGPPTL